jgi:hypothetical protein
MGLKYIANKYYIIFLDFGCNDKGIYLQWWCVFYYLFFVYITFLYLNIKLKYLKNCSNSYKTESFDLKKFI